MLAPSSDPIESKPEEINLVQVDWENKDSTTAEQMDQPTKTPSEANAETRRYQYKLGNYDDSWTDLDSDRTNVVPNLDPGTYSLQIRASDDNGRWNDEGTSLSISVVQPWWEFWWFRASLVILAGCIGYGIYLYTTTRHMDAVSKLRNSIALDLHDEVGSTMSSIYIASRLIQTNPSIQDPKVRELIDKMVVNSEYIMDSMSDIVWTLKSENDRFSDIVSRMRMYGVEILEPLGCMLTFTVGPSVDALELNLTERKNLYLIFKETINNIAKYSAASHCTVIIDQPEPKTILMSITDDGKGFDPASDPESGTSATRGGQGMKSLQYRADQLKAALTISSAPNEGTTVTLRFKRRKSY